MATNTTNFGFKKPDESDYYSIEDQNNNWDLADEELQKLDTPTFEDYTGSTAVPAAATALEGIKSKGKLATLLSNIKAFAKGCCTLAMIVDNCTTDRPDLPGSAAQLKVLMDLYTQLNSNKFDKTGGTLSGALNLLLNNHKITLDSWDIGAVISTTNTDETIRKSLAIRTDDDTKNAVQFEDSSNWYIIFGEHNKPYGSYDGNGDVTRRTISTGGIGNCVLICDSGGICILTPRGGFAKSSTGEITAIKDTEGTFVNGVISLITNNSRLNSIGTTYTYEVL